MNFITALVTGAGLAMDSVAASISGATASRRVGWRRAVKAAVFFGLFQAIMPALGYLCGIAFRGWFEHLDHWVAFALLGLIGAKMIHESRRRGEAPPAGDPFGTPRLLLLSVATSVDALAAGVSLSLLKVPLLMTVTVIGVVTFALCLPAAWLGRRLGSLAAKRAELLGGVMLIAIGFKILAEHLSA